MADDDVSKGVIKFKVKKSWLTEKGYGRDAVSLHRYHDKKWDKLETTRTGFGAEHYYYSAESSGFSTFAITAEKAPVITASTAEEEEEVPEEVEEVPEEAGETSETPAEEEEAPEEALEEEKETAPNKILIVALITLIIIFVIVSYFVQEKKQKKKKEYKKEKKKKHKGKG